MMRFIEIEYPLRLWPCVKALLVWNVEAVLSPGRTIRWRYGETSSITLLATVSWAVCRKQQYIMLSHVGFTSKQTTW